MGVPVPGYPVSNVPYNAFTAPGDIITGVGAVRDIPITAVFSLESIDPVIVAQTWSVAGAERFETTLTAQTAIVAFILPTAMAVVDANVRREKTTRLQTFTMTVIDEEPGERTLNAPASSNSDMATHTVTLTRPTSKAVSTHMRKSTHTHVSTHTVSVIHQHSTKMTLSPTLSLIHI